MMENAQDYYSIIINFEDNFVWKSLQQHNS